MIGHLRGQLLLKKPSLALVEVQGVGYEVHIPLTTFYELPESGEEVALLIHTHVREDALLLFGFISRQEKDFFLKLLSVGGIGPKLALTILSGGKVEELAQAIVSGELIRLTSIPGVGKKTAERMILELKSHASTFLLPEQAGVLPRPPGADLLQEDILSALVNLGYPRGGAERALSAVLQSGDCDRNFEDLLRNTLRRLSG